MEKDLRIVVLQRGWVLVGEFSQLKENCTLENAAVVRIWGTTKGLGQLAVEGPTSSTKLDPCPTVNFHELTAVFTLDCKEEAWSGKLGR